LWTTLAAEKRIGDVLDLPARKALPGNLVVKHPLLPPAQTLLPGDVAHLLILTP
jgi:hypothetical protein